MTDTTTTTNEPRKTHLLGKDRSAVKAKGKLPVPPPKASAPDADTGIPASLDRNKGKKLTGAELTAELKKLQAKKSAAQPKPVTTKPAPTPAAAKILAEVADTKKTKRQVREEKKAAAKSGATTAMPLTGKDALKAIATDAIQNGAKITKVPTGKTAADAVQRGKAAKGTDAPAAAKKSTGDRPMAVRNAPGKYDWDAATKTAQSGKVPPCPTFNSYRPHTEKFHAMAMKRDAAGIKEFSKTFCDETGARANMFRFRDLCLVALKAK